MANQKAQTIVKTFINQFVDNYGWPEKILTYQAQNFEGKFFKKLCDQALIKKTENHTISPTNQWTTGMF